MLSKYLKMGTIRKKIVSFIGPSIIIALVSILSIVNFDTQTWLTGWDNLHPEFNLLLNLKRSFYAVWQEYQGLGLLGGMAHASDLPRQLILFASSIIVPANLLRYFWTFLMLLIGPLGVYFLVKNILLGKKGSGTKVALISTVASVFYLLNLATVQYFYTPYESFVSFYGFLPWLLYFPLSFLASKSKKDLIKVFAISVLATASFYVQTLFVVYLIVLLIFIVGINLKPKRNDIIRYIKLLFVIFAANAFWLLPNLYFVSTNPEIVNLSKINSFSTPETQFMNQATGNLSDISLLKGFWFEYSDLGTDNQFVYLMAPWREHLEGLGIEVIGYFLFAVSLIGIIYTVFSKSSKFRVAVPVVFAISLFMLATVNPPLGFVYTFLNKIPFFASAFRSVFTKWSVVAALSFSFGIAYFVKLILENIKGIFRFIPYLVTTLLIIAMVWFTKPAFEGQLIMKSVRQEIPHQYFELFEYFRGQSKQSRIALFPIQTFWGWYFHDWGHRGSGFIWYGVEQPILSRTFDVWSNSSESFYNEVVYAFYGNDAERLRGVLDKYGVDFILVDKSIKALGQDADYMRFDQLEMMMESLGAVLDFEKGDLQVYKFATALQGSFVYSPNDYQFVSVDTQVTRRDDLYFSIGNYLEQGDDTVDKTHYPFGNIWQEEVKDLAFSTGFLDKDWVAMSRQINVPDEGYELVIPAIESGINYQGLSNVTHQGSQLAITFKQSVQLMIDGQAVELPELSNLVVELGRQYQDVLVSVNGQTSRISKGETIVQAFPLWVGSPIYVEVFNPESSKKVDLSDDFSKAEINTCWTREGEKGFLDTKRDGDTLSVTTKDLVGCTSFKVGELPSSKALLSVTLPFKSFNQSRPDFCVVVEGTHECLNEEVFYKTAASSIWSEVNRQMILDTNQTYWLVMSAKPSDKANEKWQIDYLVPQVESFPLITSAVFDARVWQDLAEETRVEVKKDQEIRLSLFGIKEEVDLGLSGQLQIKNCDVFERGSVEKKVDQESVYYSTIEGGAACDYTPLSNVSTLDSYLIRLIGENFSGRGLKFYLYNKSTSFNDLEVLLSKGKFDQTFSILPWSNFDQSTYVLNVDQRSFGEEAKSKLDNIEIYQLPLSWISSWRIENTNNVIRNDVVITNVSKSGTHYYSATVDADNEGAIVLSQQYHPSWQAYAAPSNKGRLFRLLPWIIGEKLDHYKLNSWANGWLIPEGQHQIIIVFWPQYLQYLGLTLLIITFPFLLLFKGKLLTRSQIDPKIQAGYTDSHGKAN